SAVTCGIAMLLLDPVLGGIAVLSFPVVLVLTRWFRAGAERAYRATPGAIALVIVHFTESLGGIRAVQAFRRQPRNQAIFDDLDDRYREANAWTMRLGAVYAPGLKLLGHVTTAVMLLVGAERVLHHQTQVGVLAAMFLYLRRFYDPMQDLAQFYNVLQAAAAAVEKVAGVLDEQPAVPEPADSGWPICLLPDAGAQAAGEIRLEGVRFSYGPNLPCVIGHDRPLD